jgi:hypothetical protein
MSDDGGYVKSFRRKWEHPIFRSKQEAAVWAWMCDAAQWQEAKISTKFGPINLKRGELLIAERVVAEDFGLHRNTVRDLLNRMIADGMIEPFRDRCPARAGTVVKVVNYDQYQTIGKPEKGPEKVPETVPQKINSRTAKGPQNNQSNQEFDLGFENDQDRKPTANGTANCTANGTKNNEENKLNKTGAKAPDRGSAGHEAFRPQVLADIWNATCGDVLPKIRGIDGARASRAIKRFNSDFGGDLDQWQAYCTRIRASGHLTGNNNRGWKTSFDWVIEPGNLNKILEGNFDNRGKNVHQLNLTRTYQPEPDLIFRALSKGITGFDDAIAELDNVRACAN